MSPFTEIEYLSWLEELLKHGKTVQVPVIGMSMFPFLMKDDVIQVSPIGYDDLKPGQILIFTRENRWIAHRLIKSENGFCYTRGDGNAKEDEPIPFKDVKGVLSGIGSSRWILAKYSFGRIGKVLIKTGVVTGPTFWFLGILSYKILCLYRRVLKVGG
ncbi:S24/S26 family peptidase [Alkalitalea saponilacus]|uniref:Signal peptidase I n=1 Tax=Alkalitalea saponilacus TaxID=889453 RepID=A0A1T5CPG8_9BACT|nr:S24 family peptidase [Alkalitalea saponilacus]ASB49938.1 peptidase S24 [Alkalitalea saponilacus]SKB61339.1 signal peptidase I [Alkalitalea saponilacus]